MSTILMTSTACILINNSLEDVGDFFSKIFDCPQISISEKPIYHGIVILPNQSENSTLLFVDRRMCPVQLIESLESMSVKQIYVYVEDPTFIQHKVTSQSIAQVTESNFDPSNSNSTELLQSCVLEGPDGLVINIIKSSLSQKLKGYEIILNSLQSRILENDMNDDQTFEEEQTQPIDSLHVQRSKNPCRIYCPTIKSEALHEKGSFINCPANPKYPVPFETELFKGVACFAIRTEKPDPMYESFFTGKRLFELQIQGKFKRQPKGELFVGMEVTNKMELGLITRSVSKAVLKFCGTMISGIQHSFGDSQSNPEYQLPHLVAPMFSGLDKVVITPPGQIPPKLGTPLVEDPEFKKQRSKYRVLSDISIDTDSIYSMSVNSNNIDFLTWSMTGIPLMRPFDIRPFFGDSSIRMVGYEIPRELYDKNSNVHPHRSLNYLFAIKLTRVSSDEPVDMSYDDNVDDEIDSNSLKSPTNADSGTSIVVKTSNNIDISINPTLASNIAYTDDTSEVINGGHSNMDDDDNDVLYDENDHDFGSGENYHPEMEIDENEDATANDSDDDNDDFTQQEADYEGRDSFSTSQSQAKKKRGFFNREETVSNVMRKWFSKTLNSTNKNKDHNRSTKLMNKEISETVSYTDPDYYFEVFGDLRYCPACIEINDTRDDRGKRRMVYLLPWPVDITCITSNEEQKHSAVISSQHPLSINASNLTNNQFTSGLYVPRLRSYTEISKAMKMLPLPKLHKNKKFSDEEKRRRQIIETYKHALNNAVGTCSAATGLSDSEIGSASNTAQLNISASQVNTHGTSNSQLNTASISAPHTSSFYLSATVNASAPVNNQFTQLHKFLSFENFIDKGFLQFPSSDVVRLSYSNQHTTDQWEGCVATAKAARHWVEKQLILTRNEVTLSKNAKSKRNLSPLIIPLSSIVSVNPIPNEKSPFLGFSGGLGGLSFFEIETTARVHYFMVKSEIIMKDWLIAFKSVLGEKIVKRIDRLMTDVAADSEFEDEHSGDAGVSQHCINTLSSTIASLPIEILTDDRNIFQATAHSDPNSSYSPSGSNLANVNINVESVDPSTTITGDVEDVYMGKPADWKLERRRILNYRRVQFHPYSHAISERLKSISCLTIVEDLLYKAFNLFQMREIHENNVNMNMGSSGISYNKLWTEFNDELSILQIINIKKLNEKEKTALFLNIYHIMILHGYIVFGPPMAWVNWQTFFNSVSYLISNDIVSIAELEQHILRAGMSKSSMLFSKTIAPQSTFPIFALKHRDFRLTFCINNGSASMASCVPIYKPDKIDVQLDEMTSLMLSETIEIDEKKRIVILPKICSSYLQDFAVKSLSQKSSSTVSPLDCLRVLASYLNYSDRNVLVKLLTEGSSPSIKFKNFNFTCRRFELYQDSVPFDYNVHGHS